jgi:excisionase family DNA binding protein
MTLGSSRPLLMTVAEAAEALGVGRSTLYDAIKSDACPLPVVRLGKQLWIPRAALDRLADPGVPSGAAGSRSQTSGRALCRNCPSCGSDPSRSSPTKAAALWSSSVTTSV